MGLLTVGKPVTPEETWRLSQYVREHGITQFLNNYFKVKDLSNDELRYGDEIESGVFVVDLETREIRLSLRSAELRAILTEKEKHCAHQSEGCTWHPEFGAWMIESTPSKPYTNFAADLLRVERNMILRRSRLLSVLGPNEIAPTVTAFPLFGVGAPEAFIHDALPFSAEFSASQYLPDYVINPHPRFGALTRNIRARRGEKVNILVPLFRDTHTPEFLPSHAAGAPLSGGHGSAEAGPHIHMDCMAFGMGMCCLQVTFQARDIDESRYMYDQLAVLAPIMLAMTAASPIFKGRLANVDARWDVIAQSVDDRTAAERGLLAAASAEEQAAARRPGQAGEAVLPIPKSRYGSISTYIYHCKGDPQCRRTFEHYNDIPCPVDGQVKQRLLNSGIDENLAHHLAHLFTRDPLVLFEGMVELDDYNRTEHFENVQSTNWQTCRWKPPPPREHADDPHIGWRTEFRSMEVQLTDFENAAFTVFVVLLTRVVLAFDLALYIPLSKVDENMRRAQEVDAVTAHRFFFRKYLAPLDSADGPASPSSSSSSSSSSGRRGTEAASDETTTTTTTTTAAAAAAAAASAAGEPKLKKSRSSIFLASPGGSTDAGADAEPVDEDAYEELTMEEIFHGKADHYPGLLPLVYAYLDYIQCDPATHSRVDEYLQFIGQRARGELKTTARWMRDFVQAHPSYKHDSVVPPAVALDLMMAAKSVGDGSRHVPELVGAAGRVQPVDVDGAFGSVLKGQLSAAERSELVSKYMSRATLRRREETPRGKSR